MARPVTKLNFNFLDVEQPGYVPVMCGKFIFFSQIMHQEHKNMKKKIIIIIKKGCCK